MGFGYGPIPTHTRSNTAAPTGTASATSVMAGLGVQITPSVTGRMLLLCSGCMASGTTNDGGKVQFSFGTGAPPSNGGTLTGTQSGTVITLTNDIAGAGKFGFSMMEWVTTFTPGVTYWVDLAFAAITGGTFSLTDVTIIVLEL
jgi:hypothetical protein